MRNKFDYFKEQVAALACSSCKGVGELNDAEPGDTFFNTWKCPDCKGSGLNDFLHVTLTVGTKLDEH